MAKFLCQSTKHIVIITPYKDMGVILRLSLNQITYIETSIVSSITQGISIATAIHPDLLVLDADTIEEEPIFTLRAVPVLQEIPIIFLISRVRAGDRQQSEQLGINCILAKPFDPSELINQVKASLQYSPDPIPKL